MVAIYSFTNTSYHFTWQEDNALHDIALVRGNFYPLAGVLAAGYYFHSLGIPIINQSKKPENNVSYVFTGYVLVCLTYILIGCLGYLGFSGSYFAGRSITQNCLNMFAVGHPAVFIIRAASFIQIFSVFPLLFNITRDWFYRSFYPQ